MALSFIGVECQWNASGMPVKWHGMAVVWQWNGNGNPQRTLKSRILSLQTQKTTLLICLD